MLSRYVRSALLMTLAASPLFATAPITIVVVDEPGIGFNDPRPAAPVGGNTGATVGEQRLNALRYAAGIWSAKLDSTVPIRVRALFDSLPCTDGFAIAGVAGTIEIFRFAPGHPEALPNIWYPSALANKLNGSVVDPSIEDISIIFNLNLGQPHCFANSAWYYGQDTNAPPDTTNLASVALHELAHGLGFLPIWNDDQSRIDGYGDVYCQYVLDTSAAKTWNQMTDEEREASATNTGHVVWTGINVQKDVPKVLQAGTPVLRITEPASIARQVEVSTAEFGAPINASEISGELVAALDRADDAGPSSADACSPIVNAAEVAGHIALIDRGACSFVQKALNVQAAGSIGLVVVDNVKETPPPEMAGHDDSITIPLVHIRLADGDGLKAALAARQKVNVRLVVNLDLRRGADAAGRPLLFAPNPQGELTPIGHWDPNAAPNQLMEPAVQTNVKHSLEPPDDLTLSLMRDLGWFSDEDGVSDGVDQCPGSDRGRDLTLLGCETGVNNTTYTSGCRISDFYKPCAAGNGGNFAACVDSVSKDLMKAGAIGLAEASKIQACAVRSAHP